MGVNITTFPQLLRRPLVIEEADRALIAEIQNGLPVCEQPYARIGLKLGMSEQEVITRLRYLLDRGVIKRMGVIVRHHELGYRANAMVVFDVPDEYVSRLGRCIGRFEYVTLCYRRPRRLPDWPYNLFCMIHGKDRTTVLSRVEKLREKCVLDDIPYEVLFSNRRFKQRGAIYCGVSEPFDQHGKQQVTP